MSTKIETAPEESVETEGVGRRQVLGWMASAAVAAPLLGGAASAGAKEKKKEAPAAAAKGLQPVPYTLPPLPYAKNALDGYLSAEILELHHDKHHAGYVKGLNEAMAGLEEARKQGNFQHIKALERSMAFNGSGHVLHSLYWESMSPQGGGAPSGQLAQAIQTSFGSLDNFRKHFAAATKAAEASAWGILAYEPLGQRLVVIAAESHQNMGFQGAVPLLCCDVWEHAYYLRYKNDRATYVDRFFEVINWETGEKRLQQVLATQS